MNKPNIDIEQSRIKVFNEDLIKDVQKTFVTSPVTASASTLTVQNITGGAISGYIILGQIGSEKTEIIQIHAATAPSGTTITLAAGDLPAYNHPTDTPVYFVNFNQVEFSRATSSGGAKTILATSSIAVDQEFTSYNDSNATGFAYVRWVNGSTYSQYSDEQAYASREQNKVGTLIDRILRISHSSADRSDVLDFLKDGLTKIYESRSVWSFEEAARDETNSFSTGTEEFTLPTDLKENKKEYLISIYPEGGTPLEFIEIRTFIDNQIGVPRTTLNGAVLLAATSVILTDSSNFGSTGTAYIGTDAFTWTGKTTATHTLTGVDGILAHDSGSLVLGKGILGLPTNWTIWGNVARLYPAPSTDYTGRRLLIEYYKDVADFDSENDEIPIPFWTLLVDYVLMRIAEMNNEATLMDRYELRFTRNLAGRIAREKTNQIKQIQID